MTIRRSILILGIILFVLVSTTVGGLWAAATVINRSLVQQEHLACPDPTSPYYCKVTPGFIYSVTGIDLPAGTTVVSGGTNAWTSWNLYVTVAIPKGAPALAEGRTSGNATVTYKGLDRQSRQLFTISQTRSAGQPWPKP